MKENRPDQKNEEEGFSYSAIREDTSLSLQTERDIENAFGEIACERLENAAAIIRPLLERCPNDKEVIQLNSAYCYFKALDLFNKKQDLDQAQTILEEGLKLDSDSPGLKKAQGIILNAAGIKAADRAAEKLKQGEIKSSRDMFAKACSLLRQAMEAAPGVDDIKVNLRSIRKQGESLFEYKELKGDKQKAFELNEKAVQIVDKAMEDLLEQGDYEQLLVLYRQALKLFEEARALNPFDELIEDNYQGAVDIIWAVSEGLKEEAEPQKAEANQRYDLLDFALGTKSK